MDITPTLRMLTAGEDPLYIARRCIVMASEDIGLANDRALPLAIAAYNACQIIGMPECRINLAHLVAYLAESPKSTRSYEAYNRVRVFMPRYLDIADPAYSEGGRSGEGRPCHPSAAQHMQRPDWLDEGAGIWSRISVQPIIRPSSAQ